MYACSRSPHRCWALVKSKEFDKQEFIKNFNKNSYQMNSNQTMLTSEHFPAFYVTGRFNTAFTRALHCSLYSAISIPSCLSKIHFNIVHSSTFWSSQWYAFLLAFPPISYVHSSSPPFVLQVYLWFCWASDIFKPKMEASAENSWGATAHSTISERTTSWPQFLNSDQLFYPLSITVDP
jgi:hypothetical protein